MQSLIPARGVAALIALALPMAACGSSKPTTASVSPAASKQANGIALANCMRANGVSNFPDPTTGSGGGVQIQQSDRAGSGNSTVINGVSVSSPTFRSAQQKCRRYFPNGGRPPGGPASPALQAAALKYADCIRAHGVPGFPDPKVYGSAGRVAVQLSGGNFDPNSPAFKSAQQACRSEQGDLFGKGVPPGP